MKNTPHASISSRGIAAKAASVMATVVLSSTSIVLATTYTWEGDTDDDWDNANNWDANGVPLENERGVTGADNMIVIQNGTYKPTTNVPTFNGGLGGTPRFVIEDGAALSINQAEGGWDGPTGPGDVVTVGSGASLVWGNDAPNNTISLMRDPNGTQTFDISGGIFTIDTGRLDWGFNENRVGLFNLDDGDLIFTGGNMFGTRFGASEVFASPAVVTLDNGSTFSAPNANFQGNMQDADSQPTVVFDIKDGASSATAKFGNFYPDISAVEAAGGEFWISSTLGDENLVYTDNGDGTFTVTVDAPAAQRPLAIESIVVNADGSVTVIWISEDRASYALDLSGDMTPEGQTAASWAEHNDSIDSAGTTTEYTVPAADALAAENDGSLFLRVRKR